MQRIKSQVVAFQYISLVIVNNKWKQGNWPTH